MKTKKQKLKELLLEISPKEEREKIILKSTDEIYENINILADALQELQKDYDKGQDSIVRYVHEAIEQAKGQLEETFQEHKGKIEKGILDLSDKLEVLKNLSPGNKDSEKIKGELMKEIKTLSDSVDGLRNLRPNMWGGSSRTLYLNGQTISPENLYSDVNLIPGSGISIIPINNPQTLQVDVTISSTGGGGLIGGSIADTQVAFGTAANTIGGSDNFIYDTENHIFSAGQIYNFLGSTTFISGGGALNDITIDGSYTGTTQGTTTYTITITYVNSQTVSVNSVTGFTVGHTVTGVDTLSTGTILAINGLDLVIDVDPLSDFSSDTQITDDGSSTTANVTAVSAFTDLATFEDNASIPTVLTLVDLAAPQTISGITFSPGATTGHTVTDSWSADNAYTPGSGFFADFSQEEFSMGDHSQIAYGNEFLTDNKSGKTRFFAQDKLGTYIYANNKDRVYGIGAGTTGNLSGVEINDDHQTFSLEAGLVTKVQYETPNTGDTVTIGEKVTDLIIDPAGALVTLTIVFPTAYNGRRVTFCTTQNIATLIMAGLGAPTSLGVNGFASFVYSSGDSKWHRNG